MNLFECGVTASTLAVLENGKLPALTALDLRGRGELGDFGCVGLVAALRRGALPRLEEVSLCKSGASGIGFEVLLLDDDSLSVADSELCGWKRMKLAALQRSLGERGGLWR